MRKFVQNRGFQPAISTFSHFGTWRTTFRQLSAKCTSLYKTAFLARDQHVLSFSHCVHQFVTVFRKEHEFVQNRSFQPEISKFCHFRTGRTTFYPFLVKCRSFVPNSVFSPTSDHFAIITLGLQFFSDFKQSAPVFAKQRLQPEISKFCHFRTGYTTF